VNGRQFTLSLAGAGIGIPVAAVELTAASRLASSTSPDGPLGVPLSGIVPPCDPVVRDWGVPAAPRMRGTDEFIGLASF
jgi:hypothetical protein